ncbi:hypothetical protein [Fredinandcohnia sp. 179-A 10B2 NHS]|uniref:hypothetical protein n=1 Tax=Fredinandcohnia sp. 179-A 10B2 NHS TaxID=3235176 RepID=UPI0039A20910
MKLEMGESLMLSWLRHVKHCQSAQLNWKPSNTWFLHNEAKIETIFTSTKNFFEQKHNLNLFKKTKSFSQLLIQGEIDVLGLQLHNGRLDKIYGIDVSFHESGLRYGSSTETVERVLKKMIRTAMTIYGYFNLSGGTIIFASPKISEPVYNNLQVYVKEAQVLFNKMGFDFNFKVFANGDFKSYIFEPVVSKSDVVADTSELFMRSIQMYKMFDHKENEVKESKSEFTVPKVSAATEETKIGQYVVNVFTKLASANILLPDKLNRLQDERYCKDTFDMNFPVLKKVVIGSPLLEQRQINGYSRYYAKPLAISGEKYLLSNDWYERNRPYFNRWLKNIK